MNRWSIAVLVLAAMLVAGAPAVADTQGRGEGGIVIADNVPIYKSSDGDRVMGTCVRGDIVAAMSSILARDFVFSEKNGRVQVTFFPNAEQTGLPWTGWIDPKQLSKFSYDCSCSADKGCMPTRTRGLRGKITMDSEWNTCFQEARDTHLAALKANNWGQSAAASTEAPKTVEVGQTIEQVDQILGAPQKILKAGTKVIYIYQDLKVTFENGKVADLQ
jgi:hypothetical protein